MVSSPITIQQIRVLLAVVTYGGFRAASRALNVSQSGLTKAIAALEQEYGVDLIERNAKGVLLTAHGEAFLPLAKAMLEETERAEKWLRHCAHGLSASVALGASVEPSADLVPSVLKDFRRTMPSVMVRLTQGVAPELLSALRENRIELAITKLPRNFDATDLRVQRLYQAAPVVVARAGHPLAGARSVRELLGCDWLVVGDTSQQGAESDDSIWDLFDREGLGHPRIAAVCSSVFALLSLLVESDALARVPRSVLDHTFFGKCLVEVTLNEAPTPHWFAVVSKASRRLSPEGQTLSAMLSSYARISRAMTRG